MSYLTVEQAADRVGKTPKTIRRWVKGGTLEPLAVVTKGSERVPYFTEAAVLEADRQMKPGRPRKESTDLDGATAVPADGVQMSSAREFAAFWNALSEERREEVFTRIQGDREAAHRCFMMDHDSLGMQLERMADLLRGRVAGGAGLIVAERVRQVQEEGYTPDLDRGRAGELATAGSAYAWARGYALTYRDLDSGRQYLESVPAGMWPWPWDTWKPTESAVRDLVKAGALIAAAIDVLLEEGAES